MDADGNAGPYYFFDTGVTGWRATGLNINKEGGGAQILWSHDASGLACIWELGESATPENYIYYNPGSNAYSAMDFYK